MICAGKIKFPYRDNYYIFDGRQQEIVCFDRQGRFIFKISKKGRGPEEYSYLGDFNIDPFNGQLLLLVPFGEILYFDPEGRFLSKTRLPQEIKAYNEVYALNRDELLFVSAAQYGAVIYSRPDNKITGTLNITSSQIEKVNAYKENRKKRGKKDGE